MSFDQPKEQKKARAASNSYFTYAPARRRYVRKAASPKRKPRVATRKVKAVSVRAPTGVLRSSVCVTDYLMAVTDPFEAPAGACLPADSFPLPSQKLKTFARGNCVLGTTGYGYINASAVMANDAIVYTTTTSTSVMASNTAMNAVTNLSTGFMTQIPWTTADVATSKLVQGRLVSLGLRLRYSGSEANRQGIINMYESQDHTIVSGMSYDFVRTFASTRSERPAGNGEWSSVLYSGPVIPVEMTFQSVAVLTGVPGANGPILTAVIKGAAGDNYEFEIFQHIEAIGEQTTGKTISHNDAQGFAKAQEVTKEIGGQASLSIVDKVRVVGSYVRHLAQGLPFVIETGSNIARALAGNPMALLKQITGQGMNYIPPSRTQARLEL